MDGLYLGIDVGTGSARAGLFDGAGTLKGSASHPIRIFRPAEDFVEHSSEDIWRACGEAVRGALRAAGADAGQVRGIGFDATCSLVILDANDRPVGVSPGGQDADNVICWMDHRATAEAARINATRHEVLRYVGGVISPEMQTPKLLWLKANAKAAWARAARFLDLPDFLVYRATGADVRSLCTTTCKWTYLGHAGGWDTSYFEGIGLGDLAKDGYRRIGANVRPMGERAGALTESAAKELRLAPGIPVAVSIIDAHAGGLGLLGARIEGDSGALEERLALIGGTSSCHMAVSQEPIFVPGVWGPYFSAMVPGLWLTEGGQSATGALLDHTIASHALGKELAARAAKEGTSVYALLNARLDALAARVPFPAALTEGLHVLPDHHGNRSPRADPTLRGMVSGLTLSSSEDALALLYLATVQAIAHGTRHILEAMRASGHRIRTLLACGGDTKNPLFLREHADITGCRVVLAKEPEAVLLGAAMLGAVAAGAFSRVEEAMAKMSQAGHVLAPNGGAVSAYHARKHEVFLRMHDDQLAYRAIMRKA